MNIKILVISICAVFVLLVVAAFWAEQPHIYESSGENRSLSDSRRNQSKAAEGKNNLFTDIVSEFPETEQLFASIAYPDWWASQLRSANHLEKQCLLNLLQVHRSLDSRKRLRDAWKRYKREIALLWQEGFSGAESFFFLETNSWADREFAGWISDVLNGPKNDEEVESLMQVLVFQATSIRNRMNDTSQTEFARRFRGELWPKLKQITASPNRPIELFVQYPGIWDLLMQKDGQDLATTLGAIAVELFVAEPRYPKDLRPTIKRLAASRSAMVLETLCDVRFRRDRKFWAFLRKCALPDDEFGMAICELHQADGAYPSILEEYDQQIENGNLIARFEAEFDIAEDDDEFGPIKIFNRLIQGKKLDAGDIRRSFVETVAGGLEVAGNVVGNLDIHPVVDVVGTVVGETAGEGGNLVNEHYDEKLDAAQNRIHQLRNELSRTDKSESIDDLSRDLMVGQLASDFISVIRAHRGEYKAHLASMGFFYSQNPKTIEAIDLVRSVSEGKTILHVCANGGIAFSTNSDQADGSQYVSPGELARLRSDWWSLSSD